MYNWKLQTGKTRVEGASSSLHAAIDNLVYYSRGGFVKDFYVNGHHMNEEFDLVISGGKVLNAEDDSEFVPTAGMYDQLRGRV